MQYQEKYRLKVKNQLALIETNWDLAQKRERFLLKFAINFAICFMLYILAAHIIFLNRYREAVALDDPILKHLRPYDFSVPIFMLMYSGIMISIYQLIPQPQRLYYAFRAFTALILLRTIFIFVTPIGPPHDLIALQDPFIDGVVGFRGQVLNDLFFSGHVANLYLLAFIARPGRIRNYLFTIAAIVSVLLVWQKVHYTADVLAAPFFSYACYSYFMKERTRVIPS